MISLSSNEMLLVLGNSGTVAVVKVGKQRQFFVDTPEREIVLALGPDELLVASGFGTGEEIVKGLKCVLYMIRELNSPLIVLPKNHPASARLKMVLAAGKRIVLSCDITPGTHPEQHLLCAMNEFDGAEILGIEGGVELKGLEWAKYERRGFSSL
uniref:Uncharacterized protein n=1 Tax=Candidatus Methanophaga sp. ANME-1 ERB7 TaxID=2759913 RepID=A0A7G9Z1P4_9EURY|nr:hypothetical protein KPHBMPCG_00010 [Methanosarcinales archaeon ANME-1 ERB7]QNO56918.1 hypothetical protein AAPMNBCG_00018 [Methanosarcinales archaeon ANME-1 ERB7]